MKSHSRYDVVFRDLRRKKEGALVAFTVIGDPDFRTSLEIAQAMVESGADILELGIPFSDPIADGKSIQEADNRSLSRGFKVDDAFLLVKDIRASEGERFKSIPIGFLVYFNLVYQRGVSRFFDDAKKAGVDSILVADAPLEESADLKIASKRSGVDLVFMISPLTPKERMMKLDSASGGFVYLVSRLGVTGAGKDLVKSTIPLIKLAKSATKKPVCVGFGITTPRHVKQVLQAGADGAIVGSPIVNLIKKNLSNRARMIKSIRSYVGSLKQATRNH